MDQLPTEILQEIGSYLCSHCQNPGVFINADSPSVRQDRRALTRLSATSRSCRYALQPILFHCYTTEDFKVKEHDTWFMSDRCNADARLPKFLWALSQRPDLARQVKHLQAIDHLDAYQLDSELIETFDEDTKRYNLPRQSPSFPNRDCHGPIHGVEELGKGHRFVKQMVLSLCTSVETLLIQHIKPASILESPNVKLSSLTTLCLSNQDCIESIYDTNAVLAASSNLRNLYLFTNTTTKSFRPPVRWRFDENALRALSGLRKLVIEGPEPDELKMILGHCSQLEELEFYKIENYHYWCIDQIMAALTPVKDTLKRLSFSFIPRLMQGSGGVPGLEHSLWSSYPTNGIAGLKQFTNLQELGIDQASIYCPAKADERVNGDGFLLDILPPQIRKLRLSYVYRGMMGDLKRLAQAAPDEYPDLQEVVIGVSDQVAEKRKLGIAEMNRVIKKLQSLGMRATLEKDKVGANPQSRAGSFSCTGEEMIPCPHV